MGGIWGRWYMHKYFSRKNLKLGRLRSRWDDKFKSDFVEIRWLNMDLIVLTQVGISNGFLKTHN
jgi:hypothetical protein